MTIDIEQDVSLEASMRRIADDYSEGLRAGDDWAEAQAGSRASVLVRSEAEYIARELKARTGAAEAAIGDAERIWREGEVAEIEAGTTAEVLRGRGRRGVEQARNEALKDASALAEAIEAHPGLGDLVSRLAWTSVRGLDDQLLEADGAGPVSSRLGDLSARAADAGAREHRAVPLGSVPQLDLGDKRDLAKAGAVLISQDDRMDEEALQEALRLSAHLRDYARLCVEAAARRVARPVYLGLRDADLDALRLLAAAAKGPDEGLLRGAAEAAAGDGLASIEEAEALQAALEDEEALSGAVEAGFAAQLRERVKGSVADARAMLEEYAAHGADTRGAEAEVDSLEKGAEAPVAGAAAAIGAGEEIESRAEQAVAEDGLEGEEEHGPFRSAVPIVPGRGAPEAWPTPAQQRSKDRQFGG